MAASMCYHGHPGTRAEASRAELSCRLAVEQPMQAARIVEKQTVELVEMDLPGPDAGEVVVRLLECGICGSDLHAWHGHWGKDYNPGHEFCGVVEQIGQDVEGLEEGMRVIGECFAHCNECDFCQRGDYNLCENINWNPSRPAGALASRMVYRVDSLVTVPDALSDRAAALVEPLAVAFRAVARGSIGEGDTAAVVGAGTIGLLCTAVARARGAERVFTIAKYPHQAEKAAEVGATHVLLLEEGDPREAVMEATAGEGVAVAIDAAAAGTSLSTALALTRRRGHVVEVGSPARPLLTGLQPLINRELWVTGSNCYAVTEGRRDFEWAVLLAGGGAVNVEALVTHSFPLSQVAEAFRTAADKEKGCIKVMVAMGG